MHDNIWEGLRIFDYNRIGENANKLSENRNSSRIVFETLKQLIYNKQAAWRRAVFILLEIIIAIQIAKNIETVSIVKEIGGYIGQVQAGLIGAVFTGYALFQALIGDTLLLYLLTVEKKQKTKLQELNESFVCLLVMQILALLFDVLIYLIMNAVPKDWCFTTIDFLNVGMATSCIGVMIYINVETIWELKSFIFNVYQVFNANAMSRVVDIIEQKKEKK